MLYKLCAVTKISLDCIISFRYIVLRVFISVLIPSAIIQPFFELQTPVLAWKFI